MGKFFLFGFLMGILKVFEDNLIISKSVFFVKTFDKVSIFGQFFKRLVANPDLFFNDIDELFRSEYLLHHVLFNSARKIYFKVFFGREFFIKGFSFNLGYETFESEFLLLLPFVLDFLKDKQFVSGFGKNLQEYTLIKFEVIDFDNCLKCLFLINRATSSVNQVPQILNDLFLPSCFSLIAR